MSRAGVSLLAYTSVLRADTSTLPVAPDHRATEELIRADFAAAAGGALDTDSDDLPRLLGRPATSLADAVATVLKG
ncbi:hypothetical protein [Micromonospora fluostatini]|uniref:hypothetical protein n=1 Tax=Micromonospora sp. JCM 30529 TaxID=3421643 RepID=UPI003D182F3D